MWDAIKITLFTVCGAIAAYLKPLFDPMIVLSVLFVFDVFFGVATDIVVNKDRIRGSKLLSSVIMLALYCFVICLTYFVGEMMGDVEGSLFLVKSLTYTFVVFYAANILRNLKTLLPNSKSIAFLYFIFGLQILKRMPEIAEFLGFSKEKNDENK